MKRQTIKLASLLLALIMLLTLASCGKKEVPPEDGHPADSGLDTSEHNVALDILEPEFTNPLTGLECEKDISSRRPFAVMLNNIYEALPQVGIREADVLFECLAEGGITRLMGVFADYDKLGVIGSVRSSRPYYIDFAQMFDAVYCHAGGSEDAYSEMASRAIDHIDGVRGDPFGVYYRDQERLKTMAFEHTLMTTGEGLIRTAEGCSFRSDLRDGHEYPWSFPDFGKSVIVGTSEATHVNIPVSNYQTVDYYYDESTGEYLRFQYNGVEHIDGETGDQLHFKNIIVLFMDTYPYDSYGRLKVTTTGSGNGFVISEGKYAPIKWSRDSREGDLLLTDSQSGEKITVNRGKTMINICTLSVDGTITFE